ncbi:MAG TPA: hypothetical protein VG944_00810, partial [Fimbriimonas sp.]|nr:hypothetical protein [Fimbriimonas sp.]
MSTYFATFADWNQAQAAVHELVNGGVSPDDLSLIICRQSLGSSIRGDQGSVGDATYFVGRQDDPVRSGPLPKHPDVSELTTIEQSNVSPIDTSDIATDVESIDQMDDSQEEAELQTRPRMGISQGEHEVDDLALTLVTGFPTTPPMTDEVT